MLSSYQQMEIWQKSVELVTEVYQISSGFLRDEIFGLTSQIRRAAVSIPSNIVEGWGRKLTKEFIQYQEFHLALYWNLKLSCLFLKISTILRTSY
jgi:hypothetical protein